MAYVSLPVVVNEMQLKKAHLLTTLLRKVEKGNSKSICVSFGFLVDWNLGTGH
jgi:hypothetical protein